MFILNISTAVRIASQTRRTVPVRIATAQNTTQKSISIVFCVSVIRHDSSLSKYCKQKQSPPGRAPFLVFPGGLLLFTVLAE